MSIGIGITTTPNRKNRLHECMDALDKFSPTANLYIYNDNEFKGVAYAKNMCLHHLKSNDYIFLFDDDCYPADYGWVNYLITAFDNTGENHFLFLNDAMHFPLGKKHIGITTYKECGGVFMAMTKKAVNEIGYMDTRYIGWGFEHAGYSNRIHKAGLNTAPYLMPDRLPTYLFAHDYNSKIESSITDVKKQENYQHNFNIFQEELKEQPIHKKFKP